MITPFCHEIGDSDRRNDSVPDKLYGYTAKYKVTFPFLSKGYVRTFEMQAEADERPSWSAFYEISRTSRIKW